MLSLRLKGLDGLVVRTVYPEAPPRVEYALTPEGKSLAPFLHAMAKWGRRKARAEGTIIETPLTGPEAGKGRAKARPAAGKKP
jgi:DNA-binding HxlR family transcriptional regulator